MAPRACTVDADCTAVGGQCPPPGAPIEELHDAREVDDGRPNAEARRHGRAFECVAAEGSRARPRTSTLIPSMDRHRCRRCTEATKGCRCGGFRPTGDVEGTTHQYCEERI